MRRRSLGDLYRSPKRIRSEVDEEIQFHLETRIAELERQGFNPTEAREEAVRMFGDLESTRTACYNSDLRRERHMQRREYIAETIQDVFHGLKQLRRRPTFAIVAVLTLAVGIGATTAIFSAADHVLLRPLPYVDSDRVVALWETERPTGVWKEVSPGNFLEWRDRNDSFEAMGLVEPWGFDLVDEGHPYSVRAWLASEGFFDALGVRPYLGRLFAPEEYLPNGPRVIVISHKLWQQRYGSDPAVIGRSVEVDFQPTTIVGVLPPGIEYPEPKDIWGPKAWRPTEPQDRFSSYMTAVARLRSGVSATEAQADMDRVAATLAAEYPRSNGDAGVGVRPLQQQILGDVKPALLVLLGSVAFVLLIACANVASLLLARGAERERELGVRAALGAGRPRLVRQLVTESALLAVGGGLAGLILARVGVGVFTALSPPELPRVDMITIDGPVLVFATAVTLLTALLFGLAPAMRFSRPNLVDALRAGGRTATASRERIRLRSALVVSEIGLALVLLIGAGLLVRSFMDLLNNDVGFSTENRASLQLFLYDRTDGAASRLERAREIEEQFESVPGVEEVAIVTALPFHPSRIDAQGGMVIEGRPEPTSRQQSLVFTTVATPEYFQVMGIPLRAGRAFAPEDRDGTPGVAIINESLVRRFFPDEDPIGKYVNVAVMGPPTRRQIVGIVADVKPTTLESEPQPELFIPLAQGGHGSLTFVARTTTDAAALLPSMREQVWQIDPLQTVYHTATLEDLISATLVERRFHLVLLTSFSAIALVLAIIGIYGLMSFNTSQRTGEIGLRIALGARPQDVVIMIVRQAVRLAVPGVLIGIAGALVLTRFMERMLYGVAPTDFATFAQITVLMLAVSAAAAYLPARRAAAADPVRALREE